MDRVIDTKDGKTKIRSVRMEHLPSAPRLPTELFSTALRLKANRKLAAGTPRSDPLREGFVSTTPAKPLQISARRTFLSPCERQWILAAFYRFKLASILKSKWRFPEALILTRI